MSDEKRLEFAAADHCPRCGGTDVSIANRGAGLRAAAGCTRCGHRWETAPRPDHADLRAHEVAMALLGTTDIGPAEPLYSGPDRALADLRAALMKKDGAS